MGLKINSQRYRLLLLIPVCIGVIGVIFITYEILEQRVFIYLVSMHTLHLFHIIRGIGTSLILALVVTLYLFRMLRTPSPTMTEGIFLPSYDATEEGRLRHHAVWFIKIRWLAIVCATVLIIFACPILKMLSEETLLPLFFFVLVLTGLNLRYSNIVDRIKNPYRFIIIQVVLDLVVLSGFIEFSGGLENPLYLLYLLHVIIAAVLLSPRDALRLTFIAWSLLAFISIGQMSKLLPHHTFKIFPHEYEYESEVVFHASLDPLFVLGRLGGFAVIMGGTSYFVILIMKRLREDQQNLVKTTERALSESAERVKAQAQLHQASKMAAIGELTGRIAHEINNPISVINAKVKLLLSDFGDGLPLERILTDLQKVDKHTERIATITKGLLAFSRPSIGNKEPLDIHQVLRTSLNLVETNFSTSGIMLKTVFAREPLWVRGNFTELQQVILNIANNAIDAMPKGGELIISTAKRPSDSKILIYISDTGTGISDENLSHIFEPFFTTKPEGKGTGLGLAVSQGLIHSHGGAIDVTSTPDKGSTFTILLPELTEGEKERLQ